MDKELSYEQLRYYYDTTVGLYCIDQNPDDVENSKVPYSVCFEEKITIMVRKILKKILSPVVREMVKQELKSLEETISRQVVSTVANVVSSATIENFDSDN